jgi:uracil-DNA glycosylase
MDVKIDQSWKEVLGGEFDTDYFKKLAEFIKQRYKETTVYPAPKNIFKAFELCTFDKIKVVILGQDPYHGPNQAHGLSFSVEEGQPKPPSLQNIYKELKNDLGIEAPAHGNLSHWAEQGVLLLNATLTVESGKPGSHQNLGWERFTDAAIKAVSDHKEHVVFILWGSFAQKKSILIDESKHFIIKSAHPSPLSSHRGFFGSKPFSKTNEYLVSKGIKAIEWGIK